MRLTVYGAGNDVQPVVRLATGLGWRVQVVDGRPNQAQALRFPEAETVRVLPLAQVEQEPYDRSFALLMTHNYYYDLAVLRHLLAGPAPYIGLLGPRKKYDRLLEDLRQDVPNAAEQLAGRLYSPIGLNLGPRRPRKLPFPLWPRFRRCWPGGPRASCATRPTRFTRPCKPTARWWPRGAPRPPVTSDNALILLAAGASTRLGQPKQLLHYQGQTLLRRAAQTAVTAAQGGSVLVVTGALHAELLPELAGLPVRVVQCAEWERGMGASLKTGLAALETARPLTVVTVLLCDQPHVTPELLAQLRQAQATSGQPIVATEYAGVRGVPVLFAGAALPLLRTLPDAAGAAQLLRRHPKLVAAVPFAAAAVDVDTPSSTSSC
ncbi:NTP transferase domain-containing protein [Hymenobacter cellulosilyticus]|uniref:NTP transferase domain-containing protein n=1 Tax=Hymenobacter cellulosilyticus TaxID=2932248 RepID=A0A8T9PZS9_9BACT|nr:NTP transferase domain-containing protein [Hymenobacter cellulosilyticus]UOQ70255.1 NTP transferase domain-containing protein [Hymenobacter cellulosilyticus]